MATNDVILIRRNGSGIWQEIVLNSTADYVLGFDGSGNVVAKPLPALAAHESTHRAGGSDPLPWGSLIHATGLLADRPAAAAGNAGYLYFATDSNGGTVFRSNGTTWTAITVGFSNVAILNATQAFTGTNTFDDVILGGDIQALAGGDARGLGAVDLQRSRGSDTHVASGDYSGLFAGGFNTASGIASCVVGGFSNVAATGYATLLGCLNTTSESAGGCALGTRDSYLNATDSVVLGGRAATTSLEGQVASGGSSSSSSFAQHTISLRALGSTSTATPLALTLPTSNGFLTVPLGQTWGFLVKIVGREIGGANHAFYIRQGIIDNTGGTTQIRGSVQTVGVDIETNAAWDIAVTADNANDALIITVTGVALTNILWLATLELTQVTYT